MVSKLSGFSSRTFDAQAPPSDTIVARRANENLIVVSDLARCLCARWRGEEEKDKALSENEPLRAYECAGDVEVVPRLEPDRASDWPC